jgi:hypothetical protein
VRKLCLKLEDDYDSELASFLKYVDGNWIGELNPRTQLRRRPAFAHSLWNKFEATLQGKMRTNNVVEGYNHAFGLSLPSRATDWTVMDRFRTEDATIKTLLHQAAIGNTDKKGSRALKRAAREEQLKSLVNNFSQLSTSAYMESLVTFFDS